MKIIGVDGLTNEQLHQNVLRGGKFVMYQYCVSIVVMTYRRSSNIYFVPAGKSSVVRGLGFTVGSLVAGWWGIPWGPIYTVQALWTNLTGGRDVTPEVLGQTTGAAPTS
jgi:hypothetical protein